MTTYAEVVATGGPKPAVVGYDPAIERERLVFERERSGRLREKIGCIESRKKRKRSSPENRKKQKIDYWLRKSVNMRKMPEHVGRYWSSSRWT